MNEGDKENEIIEIRGRQSIEPDELDDNSNYNNY